MTDEQKNEEAHGLWELAVARLAAVTEVAGEVAVPPAVLARFVAAERDSFHHWQDILERITT